MNLLRQYLDDFSHLAFPYNCFGCKRALDENEYSICNQCLTNLPFTKYWDQTDNSVEKLFWGKIPIHKASSLCFFTKGGIVQELIHELKYKNKPQIGEILGGIYGQKLREKYGDIDVVIPVPLHQSKLKTRGYNQCDPIARGIALALEKSYNTNVVKRLRANETQTKKGLYERWINVKELFQVDQPQFVQDKHVLLVDDVVTTGSTLEACAGAILQVPGARVSLATLACPTPF